MHPRLDLPKVRKLYIPPPGHVLLECDLSGADAQVAAHECGGQFRADFFSNKKIHQETMRQFWPHLDPKQEPEYTRCKNIFFGSLYLGKPPTIAAESGAPLAIVRAAQPWIFAKYPTITAWQQRKITELYSRGGVGNAFGYRVYYQQRLEQMAPEAVNWVCSSTVAEVCVRGAKTVRHAALSGLLPGMTTKSHEPGIRWFSGSRLQVHDSLIFTFPTHHWPHNALTIRHLLHTIQVPYPSDPLTIPWSMKVSLRSWAHVRDITPFRWRWLEEHKHSLRARLTSFQARRMKRCA